MLIFFDVQTTSLIFFGRKQDGCKHSKVDKLIQNYTLTFNFVKKEFVHVLETYIYKAKQIIMTKRKLRKICIF